MPGKDMEQIVLADMLRKMQDKEMTSDSQHIFTNGKLCLIDLVIFYYRDTALLFRRETNAIYFL